jgi:hypothetical protein
MEDSGVAKHLGLLKTKKVGGVFNTEKFSGSIR